MPKAQSQPPTHSITCFRLSSIAALLLAPMFISCGVSNRYQDLRSGPEAANSRVEGTGEILETLAKGYIYSAIREPFSYTSSGLALLWHRPREIVVGNLPPDAMFGPSPDARPGTEAFEVWLTEQGLPEPHSGTMKTLVDGEEFFTQLDKETDRARSSISIQTFIFDNDDFAVAYANRLRSRADAVDVKVLYDDLGTVLSSMAEPETPPPPGFIAPKNISEVLKARPTNLKVRNTLNPWLVADHTKMYLFDDKVAFVGGMNIGREYRSEWHDLMVRIEGPIVHALSADFQNRWANTRFPGPIPFSGNPASDHTAHQTPKRATHGIRILRTDIVEPRFEILEAAVAGIRAAKRRVWLQTPYFSSDTIERELIAASERGVDVRVVFPDKSDSTLMSLANDASALDLHDAGARVYVYPGMTHLKALICDDWAMVGSANKDTLSMQINRELNLTTAHPRFVRELGRRVFIKDFSISKRFNPKTAEGILPKVAEAVADQL